MAPGRPAAPAVAVVGCGPWGTNLVRNFAAMGCLTAVSDISASASASAAERHAVPARSFDELLADPDVHALAIAAPAAVHAWLARRAIACGKHVFVEKPLALRIGEGRDLSAAADDAGVTLMVGHLLRYHPAFVRLEEEVRAGAVGHLRYLYSNRLNLGRIRRVEDILWSFAPHDISMILALVGDEPEEVTAVGASYLQATVADVTTTHLTFPRGVRAHVFVSWLHPFKDQRLVVVGEEGMLVFDDALPWESKLSRYAHRIDVDGEVPTAVKADAVPIPVEPAEPLRVECEHFVECVATGRTPRTDGAEGLRVLRVLERASASLSRQSVPEARDFFAHPSAFVDEGAFIGAGTKIWHFSHVLPGTRVGERCSLGQNVVVGPRVTVGDGCRIQNNVSIYEGVTLEDGVFCGPSCVFTNVANPRAAVDRRRNLQPTLVRRGATIGANATIVCGNQIGEYALIAAGAVVTHDVPPHALMAGVPARRIGWVSHDGEVLGDDLVCPRSGRKYAEVGPDSLREIDSTWS